MQDIITQEILRHSLVPYEQGKKIIETLFESYYELPEEIANLRPSYLNFCNVLKWGGSVENAHIASLTALNSKHGCFASSYTVFKASVEENNFADWIRKNYPNTYIHGFGSPVYKGFHSDQRCNNIRKILFDIFPEQELIIENSINTVRAVTGKDIDANLSFWSAACIYLLGLPKEYASLVFILATQIRYLSECCKPSLPQPTE